MSGLRWRDEPSDGAPQAVSSNFGAELRAQLRTNVAAIGRASLFLLARTMLAIFVGTAVLGMFGTAQSASGGGLMGFSLLFAVATGLWLVMHHYWLKLLQQGKVVRLLPRRRPKNQGMAASP